jgi:hypothetical protein
VRIQWAMPCRAIDLSQAEPGIVTIPGAGIDVVLVPELPHPVALIVAARFATPVHDAGSTVDFEALLLGPGMTIPRGYRQHTHGRIAERGSPGRLGDDDAHPAHHAVHGRARRISWDGDPARRQARGERDAESTTTSIAAPATSST